jgi:hypothetical protein
MSKQRDPPPWPSHATVTEWWWFRRFSFFKSWIICTIIMKHMNVILGLHFIVIKSIHHFHCWQLPFVILPAPLVMDYCSGGNITMKLNSWLLREECCFYCYYRLSRWNTHSFYISWFWGISGNDTVTLSLPYPYNIVEGFVHYNTTQQRGITSIEYNII